MRCSLLGSSFHCGVVAWLVQHALLARCFLQEPADAANLTRVFKVRRFDQVEVKLVREPAVDSPEARTLIGLYLAAAERGGSDVRLDLGLPLRPRAWPRAAISPDLWRWRLGHCFRWVAGEASHINVLELRAALAAVRWKARCADFTKVRFLILVDSQVAAAVLTRCRSSSLKLKPHVKQWSALCLARGLYPAVAYVHTDLNPADKPSRAHARRDGKEDPSSQGGRLHSQDAPGSASSSTGFSRALPVLRVRPAGGLAARQRRSKRAVRG